MWPWCLKRLTGGQSGTFCRSACHRERGIFITLQLNVAQCALPGTKFSFVLGHNRESVSSRLKEVVLPLCSAYCIQLWNSQGTILRKGREPVRPKHMAWGIVASMRLWANKDQTCSLKSAQLKISCGMGDLDQLQGKDNFTLRMVKQLDKNSEILYPCILSVNLYQLCREGPLHPSSTQLSLTCLGVSGLLQEICFFFFSPDGTSVTEWTPWSVFKESHLWLWILTLS